MGIGARIDRGETGRGNERDDAPIKASRPTVVRSPLALRSALVDEAGDVRRGVGHGFVDSLVCLADWVSHCVLKDLINIVIIIIIGV